MEIESGMSSRPKGVRRLRREDWWVRFVFLLYVITQSAAETAVYFK